MKRRFSVRQPVELAVWAVLLALAAVLAANAATFVANRNKLPASTFVADIEVSGLTMDEAISQTARALSAPIALSYQAETVSLDPAQIEVKLNQAVSRLQLDQILRRKQGLDQFPAHIMGQTSATRIPAPIVYSESKLAAFLLGVAARFDRDPSLAQPVAGTPEPSRILSGRQLNFVEARDAVIATLARSRDRSVALPVDDLGAGLPSLRALEPTLRSLLATFAGQGGASSVYVKNLRTGDELSINADSAVSAQGWLKLLAVIDAARGLDGALAGARAEQASSALLEGSALGANELLRVAGDGDAQAGVARLGILLRRLGMLSTFLAQPFDQQSEPATVVTPANTRAASDAPLDRSAQSTAAEIGGAFEALAACKGGGGAFVAAFPRQVTPAKCEQILAILGRNISTGLIDANVGGAAVFHRQSWDANTHADAGLVMTRDADYILVIALSQSQAPLSWANSSVLIGSLTRATHAFLNGGLMPAASAALKAPPLP